MVLRHENCSPFTFSYFNVFMDFHIFYALHVLCAACNGQQKLIKQKIKCSFIGLGE